MQRRSLPTPSHRSTDVTTWAPRARVKVRLLTLAACASLAATAGCTSVSTAEEEPAAKAMQLRVEPAKWSSLDQLPGDRTTFSLRVTNTGSNPVENLVVTLTGAQPDQVPQTESRNPNDVPQGTDDLPNSVQRKAWFIDDGPQRKSLANGETWSGGRLAPGASTTLRWKLAAITPGRHTLSYEVAGGLTDNAVKATSGSGLTGSVTATIREPSSDETAPR